MILLVARLVLAAVFAVAGFTKLQRRDQTEETLGSFGVPERARPAAALALPLAELAIAAGLVPAATARWAAIAGFLLLAAFTLAVARVLVRGEQVDCNCFGALSAAPVSRWTLVRNLGLAALAALLAVAGPGDGLSALDGATVVAVAASLAGALLLALTWFSWQLFKQNGRLLARVRALEEAEGEMALAPMPHIPGPPEAVRGLPLGEPAPDLELATPEGGRRSLRGVLAAAPSPVVLVFSDPACGSCKDLTESLPALREEFAGVLEPVLVTREGGAPAGSALAAGVTVLVQEEREALLAFAIGAVPAAVALDADGRVASPPVHGPDEVQELLFSLRPAPGEDPLEVVRVARGVR